MPDHPRESFLTDVRAGQRLLAALEQIAANVVAVAGERPGDLHLADAVEVADAPVELLQRVLGRLPVARCFIAQTIVLHFAHSRSFLSSPPSRMSSATRRLNGSSRS